MQVIIIQATVSTKVIPPHMGGASLVVLQNIWGHPHVWGCSLTVVYG